MIIDSPDDLEQLMAPPGLKEAVLHADALLANTKQAHVTSEAGTDLTYVCGEYPGDEPVRLCRRAPDASTTGAAAMSTLFPMKAAPNGTVVFQPGGHSDPALLPLYPG